MEFAENSGESDQPYKYNGKELDKMHGLNMYDYSARYYEPAIGRFTTVDPLAEMNYAWSPYVYCLNNPLRYIDPDGKIQRDKDGNIIYTSSGHQTGMTQSIGGANDNGDGTYTLTLVNRNYEYGNIYANDGTAVEALRLVEANQQSVTVDKDGKLLSSGAVTALDGNSFEATADCHGFTFADNALWINNDAVSSILSGDGYKAVGAISGNTYGESLFTNYSNSDIVVLYEGQNVVHSGKVNSSGSKSGTMDDNAGFSITQYGKSRIPGEEGISRGLPYSKSVFYQRTQSDKIVDTTKGSVVNGVRIIK
ncbi:hypothetical protein H7X66_08550 [Dysgonomonas sp. BGC7]|nr:hypothetical protein [Dysgonomonas sp. BGC7]